MYTKNIQNSSVYTKGFPKMLSQVITLYSEVPLLRDTLATNQDKHSHMYILMFRYTMHIEILVRISSICDVLSNSNQNNPVWIVEIQTFLA